jgi:hypothetical protein
MARVKGEILLRREDRTFWEVSFCALSETLAAVAKTNGGDQL